MSRSSLVSAPIRRRHRAPVARLAALWLVMASTAVLAPRPAPADPWQPAADAATRWASGRVDADLVAWSAGTSTAAACEAMRAARSRTAAESSTATLPTLDGELAVTWISTTASPSTGPAHLHATRWSNAAPRAPPA